MIENMVCLTHSSAKLAHQHKHSAGSQPPPGLASHQAQTGEPITNWCTHVYAQDCRHPCALPDCRHPCAHPDCRHPCVRPRLQAPVCTLRLQAPMCTPGLQAPVCTPRLQAPVCTPRLQAPLCTPGLQAPLCIPGLQAPLCTPGLQAPVCTCSPGPAHSGEKDKPEGASSVDCTLDTNHIEIVLQPERSLCHRGMGPIQPRSFSSPKGHQSSQQRTPRGMAASPSNAPARPP